MQRKALVFFYLLLNVWMVLPQFKEYNYPGYHTVSFEAQYSQPKSPSLSYGIRTSGQFHYYSSNQNYYAFFKATDFKTMFCDVHNEHKILSNYELYAYPEFRAYARTLSTYNEFITSLAEKIKTDKQFKKQTAYISGFEYSFGIRSEKSGFHDFIKSEAQRIIEQKTAQKLTEKKGNLCVTQQSLENLAQEWAVKQSMTKDNTRLQERLAALQTVRKTGGAALDIQLRKELSQDNNTISQLEKLFANDHYVKTLVPFIRECTTQALKESCLIKAFDLSDVCHAMTNLLSYGMNVLYDVTNSVGKGIVKGAQNFASIDHFKDMATGALRMGLLCFDSMVLQDARIYCAVISDMTLLNSKLNSKATQKLKENDRLQTQAHIQTVCQSICDIHDRLSTMSWQDMVEHGSKIGTEILLDILVFHAIGELSYATRNIFMKELIKASDSGALFTKEYAVEVAGFGKLIVEEGAEVATKATDVIKNNLVYFANEDKSILQIIGTKNIAYNIHEYFECLIKSANANIKGTNTAVGRAFQKHASRQGSAFVGEITGNGTKNTEQAMRYLSMIMKSPDSTFIIRNTRSYGSVLDIRLPDGMGARWTSDGNMFIGFLEKYSTK